jgi:hypothetical protein
MISGIKNVVRHPLINLPNFLTLVVLGFITFNEKLPQVVESIVNTEQVKLLVTLVLLVVLYYHPILGAVSFIAYYEILKKTKPVVVVEEEVTIVEKEGFEDNSPKFEVRLEEEVVSKMVPLTGENKPIKSNVEPLLNDLHNAGDLN